MTKASAARPTPRAASITSRRLPKARAVAATNRSVAATIQPSLSSSSICSDEPGRDQHHGAPVELEAALVRDVAEDRLA